MGKHRHLLPCLVGGALLFGLDGRGSHAAVIAGFADGILTVSSDDGADVIELAVSNGFFTISANGVTDPLSGTVSNASVHTVMVDGEDGDDTLKVHHDGGLITATNGVHFHGGGGTNALVLDGDAGVPPLVRQTWMAGPAIGQTAADGLIVIDPNDSLGPGLFGAFDGDEEIIRFFELAPVWDTVPVSILDVWLTDAAETIRVRDGILWNGTQTARIDDGGGGHFESLDFAGKMSVHVNGQDGADVFDVENGAGADFLDTLAIYGNEISDGLLNDDDDAADQFLLRATSAGRLVSVFGQGGDDEFVVGDGSNTLNGVYEVAVRGGSGQDALTLNDHGRASGELFGIHALTVTRSFVVAVQHDGIEDLFLNNGSGGDGVEASPAAATTYHLDGGPGAASDQLIVDADGATGTVAVAAVNVEGSQPVQFAAFEDVALIDSPADLVVSKVESRDPAKAGKALSYAITVSNAGPSDATGVLLTEHPSAGFSFCRAVGVDCSDLDTHGVTWEFPVLGAGRSTSVVVEVFLRPFASGAITNRATVIFDGTESDPGNELAEERTTLASDAGADFDGDGASDISVISLLSYSWYSRAAGGFPLGEQLGGEGQIPVPADYDGDGRIDLAVYDPAGGDWFIQRSTDAVIEEQQWGWSETLPVPADYDGDGLADVTVYHPASGNWYIRQSHNGQLFKQQWGWSETLPVPADYDGDGETDITVYHPGSGTWYILQSADRVLFAQHWGWSETLPAPGYFDTDREADMTVYHPASGTWYILQSTDDALRSRHWGYADAFPVPADYDGNLQSDVAVYVPVLGTWYISPSGGGPMMVQHWGHFDALPALMQYQVYRFFDLAP